MAEFDEYRFKENLFPETERLVLRDLTGEDESLYSVLADSDIKKHDPYTFDENRVRGWIAKISRDIVCSGSVFGR